jgi:hypothetical protein
MRIELLESFFHPRLNVNKVDANQFIKAGSSIDQYIDCLNDGINSYIGIGVLNKNTKESYLLCIPALEYADLDKKIATIKEDFKSGALEICVAGGDGSDYKEKEYYIRSLLKDFKEVKYKFCKRGIYISKDKNKIFSFNSCYCLSGINKNRQVEHVALQNISTSVQ